MNFEKECLDLEDCTFFFKFFSLFLLKILLRRPGLSLSRERKSRPLLEGFAMAGTMAGVAATTAGWANNTAKNAIKTVHSLSSGVLNFINKKVHTIGLTVDPTFCLT